MHAKYCIGVISIQIYSIFFSLVSFLPFSPSSPLSYALFHAFFLLLFIGSISHSGCCLLSTAIVYCYYCNCSVTVIIIIVYQIQHIYSVRLAFAYEIDTICRNVTVWAWSTKYETHLNTHSLTHTHTQTLTTGSIFFLGLFVFNICAILYSNYEMKIFHALSTSLVYTCCCVSATHSTICLHSIYSGAFIFICLFLHRRQSTFLPYLLTP